MQFKPLTKATWNSFCSLMKWMDFLPLKMKTALDGFDWNTGNISKILKHGLSLEEVESFFLAGVLVFDDAKHSDVETRHIAIGDSPKK